MDSGTETNSMTHLITADGEMTQQPMKIFLVIDTYYVLSFGKDGNVISITETENLAEM